MRIPLMAGNWKMYQTTADAVVLVERLQALCGENDEVEVVVCPPFTALPAVVKALKGSRIGVGAQNMHWEKEGAYTGEISPVMLRDLGCRYVILGHSERRQYFGETDLEVNRKLRAALESGLTPILCIGETLEEREAGRTLQVVEGQLQGGLNGVSPQAAAGIALAYEPVWAIGTGLTATPEQAGAVHAFIRKRLAELWGEGAAMAVRILYGGSVKPDNIDALMAESEIDGALVGGSSLKAEAFARIVQFEKVRGPKSNVER
ncbi:MAG: triose-phosphate isomerase [Candidatus Methylomirabilales bacterium]|nr:triose-phosphate isomerase [candidate division NC10 bacterium]